MTADIDGYRTNPRDELNGAALYAELAAGEADPLRKDLFTQLAQSEASRAQVRETVRASLARYQPEALKTYSAAGRSYSAALNLFSTLINGDLREVPSPRAPIRQVLATSRVFFGTEALEYRLPDRVGIQPDLRFIRHGACSFCSEVLARAPRRLRTAFLDISDGLDSSRTPKRGQASLWPNC